MDDRRPKQGEFYQHFKNKLYQIIAIAKHSETGEELVIYQALYDTYEIYARPLTMFVEKVDREKYPDVNQIYRFEKISFQHDRIVQKNAHNLLEMDCLDVKCSDLELLNVEFSDEKDLSMNDSDIKAVSDIASPELSPIESQDHASVNKDFISFLDASTFEEKLSIFYGMKKKLDDKLITDMAIALDIVVNDGALEERMRSIESCLQTFVKYECKRLR